MNTANDTAAKTSNATHSVAIVAIADEFVVSCFPLVDGKTDTDREVFFQTFTDGAIARRFYANKAALLKCNAAAFDAAIDFVYYCRSSLASCLAREVRTEALSLARAVTELELATLARRNDYREGRKAAALKAAAATLASRTEGLEAKIATEAAERARLGQP